jgi:hypothetical protein
MDNPETITKSYNVRELSYRIHKSLQLYDFNREYTITVDLNEIITRFFFNFYCYKYDIYKAKLDDK